MSAAITGKEIFDGNVSTIEDLEKALKDVDVVLKDITQSSDQLSKQFIDLSKASKINSDTVKKANDLNRQAEKLEQERVRTLKLKEQLERSRAKEADRLADREAKLAKQIERQADAQRKATEAAEKANRPYSKLSRELTDLRNKAKDVAISFGTSSKEFKKAAKDVQVLDKRLKDIDSTLGKSQREVGNYGKALGKLGGIVGKGLAIAGIAAGVDALRDAVVEAVKVTAEFGEKVSFLGAVSGANAQELRTLENQALDLGRTTQRSASDVAQLQIELSKLGFTAKSIEAATEGILELSIATGEDLADSAAVTAGVLNAFQKDASQTGEVVDIMAKAFSSSALDLQKFKVAIGPVAPVANQAGISLERVTAELGILVDRNIDASTAGTALRNIFLELSKSGLTYDEALKSINEASDSNARALELFGTRGASVASILASSQPAIENLTKGLENAGGAAARASKILSDNLEGDFKASASASEGLQIALGKRLEPALRRTTQAWTNIKIATAQFLELSPEEVIEKERQEVFKLTTVLQDNASSVEDRTAALERLQEVAPDVVKGIDAETVNYEQLNKQLSIYLENTVQRIALGQLQKELQEELEDLGELETDRINTLVEAQQYLIGIRDELVSTEGDLQQQIQGTIKNLQEYIKVNGELSSTVETVDVKTGALTRARRTEAIQLDVLTNFLRQNKDAEEDIADATEKTIKPIQERIRLLKDLINLGKEAEDSATLNLVIEDVLPDENDYENVLKELEKIEDESLKNRLEALKQFNKLRKELGELEISNIRNEFDREEAIATQFYQSKLAEFDINEKELLKKAQDNADDLTDLERVKYQVLLGLQEEYLNKVENNDLERQLFILENQELILQSQQEAAAKSNEFNTSLFEQERLIENERFAIEQQALQGQQEALERSAIEHSERLKQIDQSETDAHISQIEARNAIDQARLDNLQGAIGILKNIAGESSEVGKALYLAERSIAIAKIIQNTAVANSKAVELSFVTAGQPWVGINNATAAVSIAGILAQTITDFAFKDGVIDFKGKGTGTSDDNLAWISNGESVMTAKATRDSKNLLTGIQEGKFSDKDLGMFEGRYFYELQNNSNFETRRLEQRLSNMEKLLSKQVIALPADGGYKLMDINGRIITQLD